MPESENHKPKLRLIRGSKDFKISIGSVQIFIAPENIPPFTIDAVAAEEDTYLVLSADPEVHEMDEDPERVIAEVLATRPAEPGSVIVKGGYPLRLLAIVHDLNEEPSWKEAWVASALERIFQEVETRKLGSLAQPFLGTLHGSLVKQRFFVLLREALERKPAGHLKRLWLVAPAGATSATLKRLEPEMEEQEVVWPPPESIYGELPPCAGKL
jgi:hypothetical protein